VRRETPFRNDQTLIFNQVRFGRVAPVGGAHL